VSLYVREAGDDSLPLGESYPLARRAHRDEYPDDRDWMRETQIRLIAAVMGSHGAIEYGESLAGTPMEKHAANGLKIQREKYEEAVRKLAEYTAAGALLSLDARLTLIRAAGGDQQKIIQPPSPADLSTADTGKPEGNKNHGRIP
jgi:hypothetical protein